MAFGAAGVALARLDLGGRIVAANAAFEELIGRPGADLVGLELLGLVHPHDESAVRGGRLTSFRGGTIRADLRFLRGDASTLWARLSVSLARSEDGSPAFLVASMVDVGDLKDAEAGLRRALLYDEETAMPTHRLLEDRLAVALKAADRSSLPVVVGIVRISPEASLVVAAERLAGSVRESDTVARLGHLEFAVVMPGGSVEAFERVLPKDAVASAGAAVYPADGSDPPALIAAAQLAATPLLEAAPGEAPAGPDEAADDDAAIRLQALEPVSLFLAVPDQVLRRIARYSSRQIAAAGAELVLESGHPALHIVEDGLFEVIPDGYDEPVMTLAPSDFIGTDHHDDGPLPLRLRAVTDTRLLVLHEDALERVAPSGSPLRASIRDAVLRRSSQMRELAERRRPVAGARASNVAIYSTRGGAGRTTIAMNLASELGARHSGEVLLVDMALPYNHVALLGNLVPTTCLARLSGIDPRALPSALRGAMMGHPDGFLVLPTALRPEEAELVTADLIAAAMQSLTPQFRHVIFDLGMTLSDATIAVIERCERLLVVATPELASMHDSRAFVDIATRVLQVPSTSIDVLLNHRSPTSAMDARAVEKVLGRSLLAEFRYFSLRGETNGLTGPLVVRQPQSTHFAKAIKDLAGRLEHGGAAIA